MKGFIKTALLLAGFFGGSVHAEEVTFYQKDTDSWWSVTGGAVTETG